MDRKWTFFVSSTLEDLRAERQAIANQILKMEEIPIGMEQFGAIDKSSWENIEKFIDTADYYILIIAGRYGSPDPTAGGISYTEREYRYAKSKNIPIIAVLHGDPSLLAGKYIEQDNERRAKLDAFREEVKGARLVAFYTNTAELIGEVAAAIGKAKQRFPRPGWTRHGEHTQAARRKIEELSKELDEKNGEIMRLIDALQRKTNEETEVGGGDYFNARTRLSQLVDVPVLYKDSGYVVEVKGQTTWMGLFIDAAIGVTDGGFPPESLDEVLNGRLQMWVTSSGKKIEEPLILPRDFVENIQYVFESLGIMDRTNFGHWGLTKLGRKIYVDWRAEQILPAGKKLPWA